MTKVIAKAKKKRALQEEAEAKADEQLRKAEVREARQPRLPVSVGEIRNVMADSFERLWEELHATRSMENIRLKAETAADFITGSLTYGLHSDKDGHKYGPPVKIREETVTPHYCKEHR
jgi:hypothetical protein